MVKNEKHGGSGRSELIEYVIRRAADRSHVDFKGDLETGFTVDGPSLNGGRIRFAKWSPWNAQADSPWGYVKLVAEPTLKMRWNVAVESGINADVEISYQSYLDVVASGTSSNVVHLRMKNRTWLRRRVYRYGHPDERVEIVTESLRFSYDERYKLWRIRFFGNAKLMIPLVLPVLVVFVCHYKIFRGYLREKGRLQRMFLHDGMF